jgi:hypothetical protein
VGSICVGLYIVWICLVQVEGTDWVLKFGDVVAMIPCFGLRIAEWCWLVELHFYVDFLVCENVEFWVGLVDLGKFLW